MRVSKGAHCSVPNCSNNKGKCPELTFFTIPLDEKRSKKWIININRPDLIDKTAQYLHKNCTVCSKHFDDVYFMNAENKKKLKSYAIPTLHFKSSVRKTSVQAKSYSHSDTQERSISQMKAVEVRPSQIGNKDEDKLKCDNRTFHHDHVYTSSQVKPKPMKESIQNHESIDLPDNFCQELPNQSPPELTDLTTLKAVPISVGQLIDTHYCDNQAFISSTNIQFDSPIVLDYNSFVKNRVDESVISIL